MAIRRPLVVVGGRLVELPSSDTLPGGSFDPSVLPAASDTPTPAEVIVYQSGQWVRASWRQFTNWIRTFGLLTEGEDPISTEDGLIIRTE